MEMEKMYLAPEVDVIEVAVEKGFEGSFNNPEIDDPTIDGPGGLG